MPFLCPSCAPTFRGRGWVFRSAAPSFVVHQQMRLAHIANTRTPEKTKFDMKAANRTENPNREPFHKEPNTSSDETEPYEPNRKSGSQHVNRKRANRNARTECEPFTLIKEIPFSTKIGISRNNGRSSGKSFAKFWYFS